MKLTAPDGSGREVEIDAHALSAKVEEIHRSEKERGRIPVGQKLSDVLIVGSLVNGDFDPETPDVDLIAVLDVPQYRSVSRSLTPTVEEVYYGDIIREMGLWDGFTGVVEPEEGIVDIGSYTHEEIKDGWIENSVVYSTHLEQEIPTESYKNRLKTL